MSCVWMLQRGHSGDGCVLEVCAVFCYCLLWLDATYNRCMCMAHVCFMSVVVTVWGSVGMFVV